MADIRGVDVASWQGLPSQWVHDAGAQGIEWAGVKFTELSVQNGTLSLYENPDAKADWDYLWTKKLGRVAYLYAHPSTPVGATVSAFHAMVSKLGLLPGDGIAVDLEVTDGMSPAAVSSWARELLAELARVFGRKPIIYTYEDFIREGHCEGLEGYLLWIASITTPGLPRVPAPFKNWFAQQYVITGDIDQDVAHYSSLAAMQAAMGAPQSHQVVAVHVTTGEESLVSLSHLIKCEISIMLELTLLGSANHQFVPPLAGYLDTGNFQALMPKGVAVRFLETVRS
jgi:GH25 family lysozyme M1 (1,4-beta-N-acetylmuramidase)